MFDSETITVSPSEILELLEERGFIMDIIYEEDIPFYSVQFRNTENNTTYLYPDDYDSDVDLEQAVRESLAKDLLKWSNYELVPTLRLKGEYFKFLYEDY